MWCTFIAALGSNARAATKFRPYHVNYSDVQARVEHLFGQSLISVGDSYGKALHQSRLVVCTYPQTAFSEAAASGPTILLFDPNLWEVHHDFSDLLHMLSEAGIAHYDPVVAAKFVDGCWPQVENWWHSEKVAKARATFFRDACLIARRPAGPWGRFLRKERDAVELRQPSLDTPPLDKA
jgi:putative transferase (TIGR04331 family)